MKISRLHQIEEYVYQHETVSLDELCEKFNVSKNTIRRDINFLAEKGVLEKVYGGVVAKSSTLKTFETRTVDNQDIKLHIAKFAGQFVEANDIIYIDSGTTTNNLLLDVDREMPFTLLTNNLDAINLATEFSNVQIILIGNTYKRATRSFINMAEDSTISKFNINKAFMAATGFSIRDGLSNSDPLEWEIKKQIVKRAQSIYLLADNSKFDKSALYSYASLNQLKGIVTNKPISEEYQQYFMDHSVITYLV
ncbi:DeoR/GlpR family DNA-binding transcription regulator [Enterococcus rivorum]|uniref:DeoR family transcriptional regulator n=1 Tax=Enterococcus rivorum TaxID=762845 RepID=A0A1E5L0N8_9ENTE|nr:DeoR/GlpR family DNA-binding transcription regulator [Enterococcus rivorum]MBP2098472.1 DeoR family myo-inositol catabolism operon transcriptional repressor [Enterococcus rivorum]OEH83677.1 DeoR family transcriptional regulator [Enterococcus rivorum]